MGLKRSNQRWQQIMSELDKLDRATKINVLKFCGLDAQIAMGIQPKQFRLYAVVKDERAANFIRSIKVAHEMLRQVLVKCQADGLRFVEMDSCMFCMLACSLKDFDYFYARQGETLGLKLKEFYTALSAWNGGEIKLVVGEEPFMYVRIENPAVKTHHTIRLLNLERPYKVRIPKVRIPYCIEVNSKILCHIINQLAKNSFMIKLMQGSISFQSTWQYEAYKIFKIKHNLKVQEGFDFKVHGSFPQKTVLEFCKHTCHSNNNTTICMKYSDYPLMLSKKFGNNKLTFAIAPT